jgi:alpha-glucuronidase
MILLLLSAVATAAEPAVSIVVAKAKQNDAGVALAVEDLTAALEAGSYKVSVVYRGPDAPLPPESDMILVGTAPDVSAESWKPDKPEGFRIRPLELSGRRVLAVEGDERGLIYGVFKLAERVRLGEPLWQVNIESMPAFPLRIFSEEGQLLNIPDRAYYSDKPPYVDERRLRQEVDEAKRLVDHVVRLGHNAMAVVHVGYEDYIDYCYLDKPVYMADDPHRLRSPVFCKYLTQLCDYAHARHLDVYLQVYEIQYPPQLDKLYGVDLDSPNIERVINAKIRELFERVPLDGLIITATETHPRCGYLAKQLWRKRGHTGAARMLTMYHNACKARGKRAIFRLWRIAADTKGARAVAKQIPDDAVLSIKNTGGDFFLNSSTTDVITGGVAKEQPLTIIFDTFREYYGWSRLFCYMKRWGEVVRACRDSGVVGINAWGPMSYACLWPDYEPGYLKGSQDKVAWAGHWNQFRMFTRGFTPGQANVYLLSRLMWDPDADVKAISRDFTALHLGSANAAAAAEAILASEDAFAEEHIGSVSRVTHPCYIMWATLFQPRDYKNLETAYNRTTVQQITQSNARGLEHIGRMEEAFAGTNPAKAPDAATYARFKEGIDKTALYLRTFYLWRECWWRHRAQGDLKGDAKIANAKALQQTKARLMSLFDQWKRWPEEAGYWRITFRYGKPDIPSNRTAPHWYPLDDTTTETTAAAF